jgi:hypothetical protein
VNSNKCDFNNASLRGASSKCDYRLAASSKCDFRLAASGKCDWRVNIGSLAAHGRPDRLKALQVNLAQQQLRVNSDKCDFRVTLSRVGRVAAAQPTVSASIRSDKCDFAVALLGSRGGRAALGRVSTSMASDKCDFAVNLQFGGANPLFRVTAVASSKCDFRLQRVQIREESGWRSVDVGGGKKGK